MSVKHLCQVCAFVIGNIIASIGVGGCMEANPMKSLPDAFINMPYEAQTKYLESFHKEKEAFSLKEKSTIAAPHVHMPLIIGGLAIVAVVIIIFIKENS